MKLYFIFFMLTVFFFLDCNFLSRHKEIKDNPFIMWKNDSLSCLGYRKYADAQLVIRYLDSLNNKEAIDLTYLLGKPNEKYEDDAFVKYVYFLDHKCDVPIVNGKYEIDLCWIEIAQKGAVYKCSIACQ